jgi:hypothetical protein
MPTYRYYTTDILTGAFLAELECYGVYCNRQINGQGAMNFSLRLKTGIPASYYETATAPGKAAINFERDGVKIWAGPIWSRTYAANAISFQYTAATWESYFDRVVFQSHFIQEKVNQETIFSNMVAQLQAQPACNIGLVMATLPVTNVQRTVLIPDYEYHFATDALSQLVGVDNGLEYTIDADKTVRLGYPLLSSSDTSLHYDFPGTVSNYWLPENGSNAGVKFAVLGAGSGNKILRSTAVDQDALDAGYPAWWHVEQMPGIADLTLLADRAAGNARKFKMPYVTPTFELKSDAVPFAGWNSLGGTVKVRIEDARFPSGKDIASRLMGWEFFPSSAEQGEMVKFVIEDAA